MFRQVCSVLTDKDVGYERVRLWWVPRNLSPDLSEIKLICIWSKTTERGKTKGAPNENAYRGVCGMSGGPYYELVTTMNSTRAAAKYHNPKMFDGLPDSNLKVLDKAPYGSWIVAPILNRKKPPKVVGCLSADFQYPVKGAMRDDWAKQADSLTFQRHALELAADILQPLLLVYRYKNDFVLK